MAKNKKRVVKNRFNTRIPCICEVRTANIIAPGNHIIGTISEERNDAGESDWVIKVYWDEWEKAGSPHISGIDEDLRLDEYIRTFLPEFVVERTIPDGRADLFDILQELGLTWNDRFEYMCRTHGLCGPSKFTVERKED